MCWTCKTEDLKPLKADKDTEVYKIVKHANEEFCVALYKKYCYEARFVGNEHIDIEVKGWYINIRTGFHSYKSVTFISDSVFTHSNMLWKSFYIGNYNIFDAQQHIPVDNDLYLATFKIPKDSIYFENNLGEIVSNSIFYTGKYLKL